MNHEAEFLSPLEATKTNGKWELSRPLLFYSALLARTITVPQGFRTDFASVPRLPLAFSLTGDTVHESAVVHDYLIESTEVARSVADKVFLEAMTVEKVPAWRRYLMYAAVSTYTAWRSIWG